MNYADPMGLFSISVGGASWDGTDAGQCIQYFMNHWGNEGLGSFVGAGSAVQSVNMACMMASVAAVPVYASNGATDPPPPTNRICSGSARVLKGNAATIGTPGGFSGDSVGNVMVTANGAAIIPRQWGLNKAQLRPILSQISGVFPVVGASFSGVVDIVGGAPPKGYPPGSNVQDDLMDMYPDDLIIELPGASRDYGRTTVTLTLPLAMKCPDHTKEVPQ